MPKTLLLADDSVVIQKLVGLSFANEDVNLVTTDNGDDAIARARETRPDLVLADVVMPGKSGYEVCQALKSDPELCGVPVLLLTGTFEAFDEARAREVRSDGHITKPFEAQVLVDRVNELLDSATPSAATQAKPAGPGDSAYDFFDDSVRELAPTEPTESARPAMPATDPGHSPMPSPGHDLSAAGDDAFAFHTDSAPELEPLTPDNDPGAFLEPLEHASAGEHTVALMADEAPFHDAAPMQELTLEPGPGTTGPQSADPSSSATGATSFGEHELDVLVAAPEPPRPTDLEIDLLEDDSFGAQSTAPLPPRDPGASAGADTPHPGETMLADDLFASSNDLTPAAEMRDEASPRASSDDLAFGFTPPEPERAHPEATPAATGDVDPDSTASAMNPMSALREIPDALAMAVSVPSPGPYEASVVAEPMTQAPPEAALSPPAQPSGTPEVSQQMREQMHETLEKIAWEAFADISDTIVRQVLERFEAIAWEVIPQMTESLIQEEIRRMKEGVEE